MQRKLLALAATAAALAVSVAQADHHEEYTIRPIEIYGCQYNDGKGMADLMKVTARWNKWMDTEGQEDYWAFVLVPVYHSAEIDFDFLWVGGWPDGATMGTGMRHWMTKGGQYQAEYAGVADCSVVINFATLDLLHYPDPWAPGPVEFSNCKVEKGRKFTDALAAAGKWVAYQEERVPGAGHHMLFPAFGESSDADYDFKWVTRYSYENFGKNYDMYGTGGGWRKAEELFEGLLDCDSSRVYHATAVRQVELPDR